MKSKDLLSRITQVEHLLNEFSFDELSSHEATQLKKTFDNFKCQLEQKLQTAAIPSKTTKKTPLAAKVDQPAGATNKSDNKEAMLVAHVSHEIRTPLNGIIGFADLLKEDALTSQQLERVNAIQTASYSLMEVINELLEFSKLSAQMEPFEAVHFNFFSLVRDVLYLCNTLIVSDQVALEVDIDAAIPEVLIGDPAKLSQILLNLLGNAIKFVEKGEIRLTIVPKREKNGEWLLDFTVADSGIGISDAQLPFIFESYRQVGENTKEKFGGTGLGLSIVKQIIENLGGDIQVASTLGEGTTFNFQLLYRVGDAAKLTERRTDQQYLLEGTKLLKGTQILVFEDNTLNQRLIEQRLRKWGCIVHVTDNGSYGLHLLEEHAIELVLLDLRMPGMDGFEVASHIRNNPNARIKEVPVVALTADFTIQDKKKSNEFGIDDYLLKPYSPDELLLKLIKNKNTMDNLAPNDGITLNPSITETSKTAEGFNLDAILADCMGEVGLLEELVRLYKQNALEFMGAAKLHLQQGDFKSLEFVLHKIKSGLAMMQTHGLFSIVSQMHSCSKTNKDLKHLNFLFSCFLEEYPVVEAKIDKELKRLKGL